MDPTIQIKYSGPRYVNNPVSRRRSSVGTTATSHSTKIAISCFRSSRSTPTGLSWVYPTGLGICFNSSKATVPSAIAFASDTMA